MTIRLDSFRRYVNKPLVLKDGTRIPAGVFIDTANLAVLHDPKHYKDPDTFDAYRFYNLRTQENVPDPNEFKNREQYQFVSVSKENASFGFGKHACPGRFFAASQIKLIMAQILQQYDLRYPLDVKERYPNFCKSDFPCSLTVLATFAWSSFILEANLSDTPKLPFFGGEIYEKVLSIVAPWSLLQSL